MLAGIILLVSGLLIAVYPPLLSLIVASLLITCGIITLLIAYQNRKLPADFKNPILRVFFRL
jgi:hypothetical protein